MTIATITKMATSNRTVKLQFDKLESFSQHPFFLNVFKPMMDGLCCWSGADLVELSKNNCIDTGFPNISSIRWEFTPDMVEHVIAVSEKFLGQHDIGIYVK